MRVMWTLAVSALAAAAGPPDVGPKLGERLPAFEAKDQDGTTRSFASLAGPNGLVLVFYRSADW